MKVLSSLLLATMLFSLSGKIKSLPGGKPLYSSIHWANTKNWKLYHVRSKDAFILSIDTLKTFSSISLAQDSIMQFLKTVKPMPDNQNPLWMGAYVSTCTIEDGSILKIEISQYGSFFYVERETRYYRLTDEVGNMWLSYLGGRWLQLEDIR